MRGCLRKAGGREKANVSGGMGMFTAGVGGEIACMARAPFAMPMETLIMVRK